MAPQDSNTPSQDSSPDGDNPGVRKDRHCSVRVPVDDALLDKIAELLNIKEYRSGLKPGEIFIVQKTGTSS